MGSSAVVPTLKKSSPRFNVVTWNARALLTKDPGKRRKKLQVFDKVLHSASAVLIQEMHGTKAEMALNLSRLETDWHVELNPGPDRNTGGTAILVRKEGLKAGHSVRNATIVSGRVQRVEIHADDERLILWNVHNEKLTIPVTKGVTETLTRDIGDTNLDPLKCAVWCAGDWNFLAPGDSQMSIAAPVACTSAADVYAPGSATQKAWQDTLDLMVEFQQTAPTHFSPPNLTCSRIDRIYTSTPGWILTSVRATAALFAEPRELHESGISDHAPVSASMTLQRRLPQELQPISRYVVESEHFKKRHDELVAIADLQNLPPVLRWQRHKSILRQAGLHARDALLNAPGHTEFEVNQTVATIARTVWHNDVRLARKLVRCSDLASQHLLVTHAEVKLRSSVAFNSCVEAAKTAFYAKMKDRVDADHQGTASKKNVSKQRAITRLAKLWAPQDKRLVLAAVKVPSGSNSFAIERQPERRAAALASSWSPTFSVKEVDEDKARSFCARWCAPALWHLIRPVSRACMRWYIKSVKDAAPGPDGLPYSAWGAAGDAGVETLVGVNDFLASGYSMPIEFSDQLMLFAVKGEEAEDAHEVCRSPSDTRPLSLKNSDNKLVAGIN
jgi:hypothetical protein